MRHHSFPASLLLLALAPLACNGEGNPSADSGDTDSPSDDDDDDAEEGGIDEGGIDEGGIDEGGVEEGGNEEGGNDEGGVEVEHALGTITLSESHAATGGTASGFVSAAFMPDAAMGLSACSETVAGCTISIVPDCPAGCGESQYCGFSDGCESACLDICDAACGDDEVCYFAAPGQAACRDIEHFDAGSLSFTGTTTPITLFPPYVASGFENGAPFVPGSDVTVSASGAAAAGFDAFEATFGTTTLLQAALDDIAVGEAYGDGNMPLRWTAGTDDMKVSLTVTALDGSYGTVTCEVDDTAGSFDVPREAILAAVGDADASSIAVSITRSRTEVVEDLATKGELLYAEVKPVGWVELTTASTESHVIVGCAYGELVCGDDCVDVLWDPDNCGGCNDACSGECYDGECLAEDTEDACSDGYDNDQDGYYDCVDFDCEDTDVCETDPENTNARCDDGDDNDGDGYIDCLDDDCVETAAVTVCDAAEEGGSTGGGEEGGGDNSCVGYCGGGAPSCYCDASCVMYGDCCPDYDAVC
jgi:hypothetical protein